MVSVISIALCGISDINIILQGPWTEEQLFTLHTTDGVTPYKRSNGCSPSHKKPKMAARRHFSDESSDDEMEYKAIHTSTIPTITQKRTIFDSDSDT